MYSLFISLVKCLVFRRAVVLSSRLFGASFCYCLYCATVIMNKTGSTKTKVKVINTVNLIGQYSAQGQRRSSL